LPLSLKDLRAQTAFQYYPPVSPTFFSPPQPPLNVKATGKEGYIILQWRPTSSADSYEIAVMSNQNLAAPDLGIITVSGGSSSQFTYHVGNVALLRYFAIRSKNVQAASEFSPIVSATSILTSGVGGAEPDAPFSGPVEPSDPNSNFRYDDGATGYDSRIDFE